LRFIGDKKKLVFIPKELSAHKWVKANELINCLINPNQYQDYKRIIDELLPGTISSHFDVGYPLRIGK